VAVELAWTVAEEAVVVAQIEAEVEEVVEHPLRTQTVHARRMLKFRLLPLIQLPGIHLPRLAIRLHGRLLRLPMIVWILLNLLRRLGVRPQLQLLKHLFR
jgi:hypothetical protein